MEPHVRNGLLFIGGSVLAGWLAFGALNSQPPYEQDSLADVQQSTQTSEQNWTPGAEFPLSTTGYDTAELATSPKLFENRIGYYVNEDAGFVCEGESWTRYPDDKIAWTPESDKYTLLFDYRYDGRTLSLFNGEKFLIGEIEPISTVSDRSLRLINTGPGNWLLNGESLTECR